MENQGHLGTNDSLVAIEDCDVEVTPTEAQAAHLLGGIHGLYHSAK
jgi:hypothetical protein